MYAFISCGAGHQEQSLEGLNICMYAYMYVYMCMCVCALSLMTEDTYIHILSYTHRTYAHRHSPYRSGGVPKEHIHTYLHTYINTYMHKYIRAYIQTHHTGPVACAWQPAWANLSPEMSPLGTHALEWLALPSHLIVPLCVCPEAKMREYICVIMHESMYVNMLYMHAYMYAKHFVYVWIYAPQCQRITTYAFIHIHWMYASHTYTHTHTYNHTHTHTHIHTSCASPYSIPK
jgi:hypothetical protein